MLNLLMERGSQDMINHLLTVNIKENVTQWKISNHTNLSSGATVWRNLTKKQIEMKIIYCLNSNSIDIINCAHFTWIRTFASGRSKELSPTWKLNKNNDMWYVGLSITFLRRRPQECVLHFHAFRPSVHINTMNLFIVNDLKTLLNVAKKAYISY